MAAAIQHALGSEQGQKAARNALGGQMVMEDAAEMALLLSAGDDVLEIQHILPKPVVTLTEELLWSLRAVYDRLVKKAPDVAPYVAVISMHRLAKPWEALKLPMAVSRQTQDTLISSTDMGLVGEIIFGDIEAYGKFVREARQPVFDAGALMDNLAAFTTLSSGIVKGIEMRRDGKWGQRLMKDRAQLADVMDGFMERAPKELAAALPMQKGGTFTGGPTGPRFLQAHRPGENGTRPALRQAGRRVPDRGDGGVLRRIAEESRRRHLPRAAQLQRRRGQGASHRREGVRRRVVESQFEIVCGLTAILFSEEEAEFLRRRGRAAQRASGRRVD